MRQECTYYLMTAIAWAILVSCGGPATDSTPTLTAPDDKPGPETAPTRAAVDSTSTSAAPDDKPHTAPAPPAHDNEPDAAPTPPAHDNEPDAAPIPPAHDDEPMPEIAPRHTFASAGLPFEGELSLKERIAGHDVIVRASLTSVVGAVDILNLHYSPAFGAHIDFHLRVHEYLKGSGPDNLIAVVWQGDSFGTRAEAQAYVPALLDDRNAHWEDRQAIIFLSDSIPAMPRTQQNGYYYLTAMSFGDDMYSLASEGYRQWLPSASPSAGRRQHGGAGGAASEFLLADPGGQGAARSGGASGASAETVTLGALKELITAIDARMQGSERHKQCVRDTYEEERLARHFQDNTLSYETYPTHTFASGQAKDAVVWQDSRGVGYLPDGPKAQVWLDGGDSGLFAVTVGPENRFDKDGDGTDDRVRFDRHVVATRPLPAGEYRFQFNERGAYYVICEGWVFRYEWTVTVTAPDGVLHEAFFDPVTVGTAVKADGTSGVLEPASFTDAINASATLQSISYEPPTGSGSATVKVQVDPHTGLAGHRLDFIELDGSVSLSLDVDAATVDTPNKTLSWPVSSQPWEAGDKLMLRIEEEETGITLLNMPTTITQGQSESFTVRASGLSATESYSIRLSMANGALGFGAGCGTVGRTVSVPSGSTSHSIGETLHGCRVMTETVTATLLQGSATLGTATAGVDVAGSSSVTVTLSPREEQYFTETDMTVEWTDVGGCDSKYLVGLYDSKETIVRNLGLHPAPATTTLDADPILYWEDIPGLDWFVRVTCAPSDGSGWTVVGEVSLQSGLPSTP